MWRRCGASAWLPGPDRATTLLTYELLARYSLGRADVEAINLQTADGILQGLVAQQVDAGPLGPPHNVMARREGLQSLLRTGDEVVLLQGGVGTSSQRLQERPADVEAFLRALLRSIRLLQAERAKTVRVLVDDYALAPDVAEVVYDEGVANFVTDASASDAAIERRSRPRRKRSARSWT